MRRDRAFWINSVSLPAFFALKVVAGLALLKLSALHLTVDGFTIFSQFVLLIALLNMIAIGGSQNGVIRETAVARDTPAELQRVQGAALAIWLAAIVLIGVPVVLARGAVAELLIGDVAFGWSVVLVTALILAGGPGQIFCSLLTGLDRVSASLSAQAAGLGAGTATSIYLLSRADPVGAAVAFAAGPLVTTIVAGVLIRRHRLHFIAPRHLIANVRKLVGYSGAFATVAAVSSLTLFAVRYGYRETFGNEALGYWMVANRISDTSTQLIGLFIAQFFLPRYARADTDAERRGIIVTCWAIAVATLTSFVVIFAVAPELLVGILLSATYLPAIAGILAYMCGDVLRVWAQIAINANFARGRLRAYMALDLGGALLLAAITLALSARGYRDAPYIGYVVAYGLIALGATLVFIVPRLRTAKAQ